MAFRVRGYPQLQTERPQGTAAQLGSGRIDVQDLRPGLLRGLEAVGEALHRRLTIFSGYRTDAYSQQVGGFAGDPHTRGIAADVNIGRTPIGNVPRALRLLKDQGLVSGAQAGFYKGRPDPAHVQLPASAGGDGTGGTAGQSIGLEQLWIQAGGKPALARIMAAIALAESGGRVDAVGGPNSDGSYDYGLWQINSSHRAYRRDRLLSDPAYNAKAAVSIERSQGLGAWSTYASGAYRQFLARADSATTGGWSGPRTRPGGGSTDPGADAEGNQLASWRDWLDNPATDPLWLEHQAFGWNPLSIFTGAAGAVHDLGTFLKWIAWLFHPRNILRVVEFSAGAGLMGFGLWSSIKALEGTEAAPSHVVRNALELTAAGRVVREAGAARAGRRQAREHVKREQYRSARSRARKKERAKRGSPEPSGFQATPRGGRKPRRGPSEEIPF